ncbi:SMODS domain-containing nucleotidyltransferase [Xanthocytophaga flava]|uniref:SMODS domain-containing nucleotidyltransferase n=1 Tax=Xanthocytophaga flava TaxID=3048013 RepID=UPI0028D74B2A|nr:hypothetical protein [Xanthocytophaga flavus]MDJ1473376.1 hypothetical protein [Xanthocytophaga flavus]
MSVNSYLEGLASKLIITDSERTIIDNHIISLEKKIVDFFKENKIEILEHFDFGSYTRKTLMPRKADPYSDVDYMIVFKDTGYAPNTYLDRLRRFAEKKYTTSEIYRSHPTIVLELSKIIIELVPATKTAWDDYQIPAPASDYTKWLTTHPHDFKDKVTKKNTAEKSKIRPLIRLLKYWNAQNNYVYTSYELENLIVNDWYFGTVTLWDYLYSFASSLSTSSLVKHKAEKVNRLKDICETAKKIEKGGSIIAPILSESEIQKAFPAY